MTTDAAGLAVSALEPGSRVLVVGADAVATALLAERGCEVVTDGSAVDAALLPGTLDAAADPLAALRDAAATVGPDGLVVATVRNVTHGAVRLQLLRGRFPTGPGGAPRFDRVGFQRLFREAGLVVVDHLRVRRGLTETDVDVDPAAFKPEVLATLDEDPDAETYELVFVARRGAGRPSPTMSLAEQLQERLDQAEQAVAERAGYARSLEAAMAEQAERAQELQGAAADARELREALTERMTELDLMHRQLGAARLDLELKDAFALELRAALQEGEERAHQLRMENQALHQAAEQAATLAQHQEVALAQTHASAAAQRAHLENELAAVTGRAGYRLVVAVNRALAGLGPVAKLARWAARRLAPTR